MVVLCRPFAGFLTKCRKPGRARRRVNGLPDFDGDDEKQWVIETIQVRYDEIAETVRNDPYQLTPIFWVGSGGQQVVDDWAAGFLDAVRLYADAWQPVFESDDAFLSLLALIISGEDDEALQKMKITPEVQRETLNHLPQLLPACILHLRDFMAGHGGMIGVA